ncbi:MAG: DUF2306 domain-containing protein [Verrucomicrobiaceae bacterium]|nr:MAG: DUF2306 domain-containing protein [Verrucomicrobiaceae bacterium]
MNQSLIHRPFPIITGLFLLGASLYFISHAAHFFSGEPGALGKYLSFKWLIWPHIFFGAVSLLTGPFLLWESFRNRWLKLHRGLGMAYVVAVAFSGTTAVILSATTAYQVSRPYAFSLHVWVTAWLFATGFAFLMVKKRKLKFHKEWMVRSYLLTFAFVVSALLLKIPLVQRLGSFEEISPTLFWVGWVVPLFVYDVRLAMGNGK